MSVASIQSDNSSVIVDAINAQINADLLEQQEQETLDNAAQVNGQDAISAQNNTSQDNSNNSIQGNGLDAISAQNNNTQDLNAAQVNLDAISAQSNFNQDNSNMVTPSFNPDANKV